jgi:hypothetical protein
MIIQIMTLDISSIFISRQMIVYDRMRDPSNRTSIGIVDFKSRLLNVIKVTIRLLNSLYRVFLNQVIKLSFYSFNYIRYVFQPRHPWRSRISAFSNHISILSKPIIVIGNILLVAYIINYVLVVIVIVRILTLFVFNELLLIQWGLFPQS